jgi:hypothetical protein
VRMDDNELPKKILCSHSGGQRRHGRPKSRWVDGVEEDTRKLGCRNWREDAQDRGQVKVKQSRYSPAQAYGDPGG